MKNSGWQITFFSLCFIILFACAPSKPPDMPIGERVGAPIGAVDYCKRHPADELCLPAPIVYRIQP